MVDIEKPGERESEKLALKDASQQLIEECRMVLPGIQALSGFQLTAVFNGGFAQKLSRAEQHLHFGSVLLLVLSMALIMTPAAYHRQACPMEVTRKFIRLADGLLLSSMVPLMLSITFDLYLLARVIHGGIVIPLLTSGFLCIFVLLWFVLPRVGRFH